MAAHGLLSVLPVDEVEEGIVKVPGVESATVNCAAGSATIPIGGMTCGGCVRNVRQALGLVRAVHVQKIAVGSATLSYDPAIVDSAAIFAAIESAGYSRDARSNARNNRRGICGAHTRPYADRLNRTTVLPQAERSWRPRSRRIAWGASLC